MSAGRSRDVVIRGAVGLLTGLRGAAGRASGDVRIRDGRIAAIGSVPAEDGDQVVDARGCVVLPGFVSTHHHLFQSVLKAVPAGLDVGLETWLRLVPYSYWNRLDQEAMAVAAEIGLAELLLSGCTTVCDHHYLFSDHYRFDPAALLFETASRFGVRFTLARGGGTLSRSYDTPEIVPTPTEPLDRILERVRDLSDRYHDPAPDALRRVVLAPSTPTWACTPDELRAMAVAARQMGIGLHSHLSETGHYVDYTLATYGMRPVHFVAEHGWMGRDVFFAHLVHVDPAEVALLAETGTGMAHCPQSNCRLGSGIAPAVELDRAGGRVSLGVDGAASNEAADMVSEMHCAWLVHRSVKGAASLRSDDVVRWATAGGADILGLPAIGTLAIGQAADLAVFDLTHPRYAGLHDPLVAPVACAGAANPRHVFVAGRPVVVDGAIPGLDLAALSARAAAVIRRLSA
ncbi:amidohydrolase family protein [Methylobacterium sp. Leaf89]|uniref:amidohydrolase family protein n=1 Tax=Methylobacterium sp. Leaf89 TaxID=1736245 RepID=UPI0006FB0DE2|nr:amidohydrolase family protein [Methylobacterium sp. Leaf89]KQO73585.1 amidohydrolase [Methylobacterium sp. Leaf89]